MAKRSTSVSKARGSTTSRTPRIAAVATVVIVAVVVFGGIFLFGGSKQSAPAAAIPPTRVDATYPTSVQDGVVVAGPVGAPHTLDVYEDALCPACKQFESRAGTPITNALDTGRLQVRYHLVNLLDQRSAPAGYSSLAGNAIICAAENGAFPERAHASLYAAQPEESGAGYTAEQLVALGQQLGAGPGYAPCVQNGTHTAAVAQNFARASSDPALQQRSGGAASFGTPTLVLDGRLQTSQDNQLAAVLGS